jgi:ribosomal protein S18 acetylase RimI-like enzyme
MIRFIEELSMSAWPALQTHLYDGWVLRTSKGYTKRANSINLLYESKVELNLKLQYCKEFYEGLGLPVVYKITSSAELSNIDQKLNDLGYKKVDETSVRLLDLEREVQLVDDKADISYELTDEWLEGFFRSSKIEDNNKRETLTKMLKNIIGKTLFVTYKIDGKAIGFGYGVIDNGYVGIFDIHVEESYRGNGYGKAVMSKILATAKQLGTKSAYLQVVLGNTIAENLYATLGFKEVYKYWYRKK